MIANPNGYVTLLATVRKFRLYGSIQPIFCAPASAKQTSPVFDDIANEFGRLTSGAESNTSRSVPSKLEHSIFGLSRFQSDQYNLLKFD